MKEVKDTIKNAASYSSGDALKQFRQCTEIQLMLRANFMTSLSSRVLLHQRYSSTRLKMSEPVTYYKLQIRFATHCTNEPGITFLANSEDPEQTDV